MNRKKSIKTAVFPVAGLGTRFLPSTKSIPKEMLPVFNKPIIQHAFEEAQAAGVEKFIFITDKSKDAIINHFDTYYKLEKKFTEEGRDTELGLISNFLPKDTGTISFIRQGTNLGLGHAIWCARNFIQNEPFIVILPDELILEENPGTFLKQMINFYEQKKEKCNIVSVAKVKKDEVSKYGIISPSFDDNVIDLFEKPNIFDAPSDLAINGRYILHTEIFQYLDKMQIGSCSEVQLTDSIKEMLKDFPLYYKKYEGKRFDCGSYTGYIMANIVYSMQDPMLQKIIIETVDENK